MELLVHVAEHQVHDAVDLLARERVEDNRIVHAVQELRPERPLQLFHHAVAHALVGPLGLLPWPAGAEADAVVLLGQPLRADVGGHDDDRVLEVDDAALGVGQAPVLHHLQEDVEDLRMRLLDLIQQHDAVRPAAHRLGELPPLFVTDIARRGAD